MDEIPRQEPYDPEGEALDKRIEDLATDEGFLEEMEELSEKEKDNPQYIRILMKYLYSWITLRAFRYMANPITAVEAQIKFNWRKELESASCSGPEELKKYCSENNIPFPEKDNLQEMRILATKNFYEDNTR